MLLFVLAIGLFTACKKDVADENTYGVNGIEALPPSAGKDKLKSIEQYIAILHANLFQKALSANELVEIKNCIESIGDRETAHEIIISNFMNSGEVIMPGNDEMRADIDAFIDNTYERFFVRKPTEAEKTYYRNYIESNPQVTVEMVYFAFALSNEYQYY